MSSWTLVFVLLQYQIKHNNHHSLKYTFSPGLHPVPDDNQLSDHLLRVNRQIHSRLRSSGVRTDTSVLPRVREPAAGHGQAWTQLCRRAGRVREPLHWRSRLWELRYIRHGRLSFLLAGKLFIWSTLALINEAARCCDFRHTSPVNTNPALLVIYPHLCLQDNFCLLVKYFSAWQERFTFFTLCFICLLTQFVL